MAFLSIVDDPPSDGADVNAVVAFMEAEQAFPTAVQLEGQEASDVLGLTGAPTGVGANGLIRHAITLQEAVGLRIGLYVARVTSASNIADAPSRGDLSTMAVFKAMQHAASYPPWAHQLWHAHPCIANRLFG